MLKQENLKITTLLFVIGSFLSFQLQAEQNQKSIAGPILVSSIGVSLIIATVIGAVQTYKNFNAWRHAEGEFERVGDCLKKIGAKIHEWCDYRSFGQTDIYEYHIEVIPDDQFSKEQKELFNENADKLLKLFSERKENQDTFISFLIGTTIVGLCAGTIVKVILDNLFLESSSKSKI